MIAKRDVAFVIASLVQFTVLLAAAILATLIPSGIHAGEPSRDAWYWNSKVNLHIDNHSGLVGKGHSVEELTDMVRDLPVSLIQVSAFGANGVTTYPTEIRPNPDQGDWDTLAAWRQVAKNLNKRFCIYINTRGLSLPTTHPDWMQRDAQGKGRGKGRPDWRDVCARPSADGTGVVEQVLLPLLKEIVTRYEPDGIWVDGDHARTAVCYCPHCVDAWKAETGKDRPPTNSDDPDWPRWLALEQARFDAYRRQMADVIHAVRPSCMYTSNHSWRFRSKDPRNAPAHVDTLSGDLSHGAALDLTRLSVMQISAEERLPCDVMHNVSRVSRQEASFRRILQMGGITMTSGGAWFLWVPGSTIVQPEMQERARQCAAFVVARDDALGRSNSANQTAVLLSETSWAMEHVQGHADTYGASTAEAAALALQDAGHCVDMVNESILGERIENYRTVVIANQGAVAPATLTALQSFVNRGGLLLVTGSGLRSAPDGEDRNVSELLGLVRDSDARRPLRVRLAGGPTVIQTRWSVTPDAAEVLIHDREGRAVLTRNRSGLGAAAYLAADVLSYPDDDGLLASIMQRLETGPAVSVHGAVRKEHLVSALRRRPGQVILHVNDLTSHVQNTRVIPSFSDQIDEEQPLAQVQLRLPLPAKPTRVVAVPSSTEISMEWNDGLAELALRNLDIHAAVIFDLSVEGPLPLLPSSTPLPHRFAPDRSISEDFESYRPGSPLPPSVGTSRAGGKTSILVTDQTAAGGSRSLRLADHPSADPAFLPYFHLRPTGLDRGTGRVEFNVMFEPGAQLQVELRETENAREYPVGPSLTFGGNGELRVAGRSAVVTTVPTKRWNHVEIRFPLEGKGTYELRIRLEGKEEQVFASLPYRRTDFWRCGWIGFIGSGKSEAAAYLDNIHVERMSDAPH